MKRAFGMTILVLAAALGGALADRVFLGERPGLTGAPSPPPDTTRGRGERGTRGDAVGDWTAGGESGARSSPEGRGPGILPDDGDGAIPGTVTLPPRFDQPVAKVNGSAVTLAGIFPPGVVRADDVLPRELYERFLQDAIDRRLVLQEARRLGLADTPEFPRVVEELRGDLAAMPGLTDQERQWRLDYFVEDALTMELYRKRELMARKIGQEEIEAWYRDHGSEYDWLRTREQIKGTSPDKIERRVREEIKRDLALPLKKEVEERRKAYLAELRRRADVEVFPQPQ